MTQNEFWQITPETLNALTAAWQKREHREASRFAALMALTANVHRGKDQRAYAVSDFVRSSKGRKPRLPRLAGGAVAAFFETLVAQGRATKEEISR